MKNITIILFGLVVMTGLSSCYDDDSYWLDDNISEGGIYYPLIQRFSISPTDGETYVAGGSINVEIQYWSRDEIQSIEVSADDQLVYNEAATLVFDEESEAYIQAFTLNLPNEPGEVTYTAVVRTVHDLVREASSRITVE